MKDSRLAFFSLSAVLVGLAGCRDDDSDGPKGSGGSQTSSGGMTTSSGGMTTGGTAGSPSGGTNEEGGAPGAGGAASDLAELCDKTCNDQASLACAFPDEACRVPCSEMTADLEAPDKYLAMIRCQAEDLGPGDYTCLSMDPDPVIWPAPVAGTSCEPEICAWYCSESTLWGNAAVYNRCDC